MDLAGLDNAEQRFLAFALSRESERTISSVIDGPPDTLVQLLAN